MFREHKWLRVVNTACNRCSNYSFRTVPGDAG
nr:MAG TPA: hypothetical protein [Caudoviricetes sp.]